MSLLDSPKRFLKNRIKAVLTASLAQRGFSIYKLPSYQSETSKCRPRLGKYCTGHGLDLGFGGDPINDTAIRVDFPHPYASTGAQNVQLGGDASKLDWFRDSVLDYVYSSHLLEDFDDVKLVCREWLRVLKPGGRLIIFCPDEEAYRAHCLKTGQNRNPHHKHDNFNLEYVTSILTELGNSRIVYKKSLVDIYSWDLVVEKTSVPSSQ